MIAGYIINKVYVYARYQLRFEFNINFVQFNLGLDIPNEYVAEDVAS